MSDEFFPIWAIDHFDLGFTEGNPAEMKPAIQLKAINHSGEDVTRDVLPIKVWFGSTERHPEQQFFIKVYDYAKHDYRDFAAKGIYSWEPIVQESEP